MEYSSLSPSADCWRGLCSSLALPSSPTLPSCPSSPHSLQRNVLFLDLLHWLVCLSTILWASFWFLVLLWIEQTPNPIKLFLFVFIGQKAINQNTLETAYLKASQHCINRCELTLTITRLRYVTSQAFHDLTNSNRGNTLIRQNPTKCLLPLDGVC